jgi:hypothetical protein
MGITYKHKGPRIIAVAGNRGHLWGEQHRIETRIKAESFVGKFGVPDNRGQLFEVPITVPRPQLSKTRGSKQCA